MINQVAAYPFLSKQHIFIVLTLLLFSTFTQPLFADEFLDKVVEDYLTEIGKKNVDESHKIITGATSEYEGRLERLSEDEQNKIKERIIIPLIGLLKKSGAYIGNEKIIEKPIGSHLVHVQYLAYFQNEVALFEFTFYRPKKTWRMKQIAFSNDLNIADLINQPLLSAKEN